MIVHDWVAPGRLHTAGQGLTLGGEDRNLMISLWVGLYIALCYEHRLPSVGNWEDSPIYRYLGITMQNKQAAL
jgi:hypothetical protein